jgi:hypothetical protein
MEEGVIVSKKRLLGTCHDQRLNAKTRPRLRLERRHL